MRMAQPGTNRFAQLAALASLLAACSRQDATAVDVLACDAGNCSSAQAPDSGDADGGRTTDVDAAVNVPSQADAGRSAAVSGSGGASAAGDRLAADNGGAGDDAVPDAGADLPQLPQFTLVVDAPSDGDVVQGSVSVIGRAPGFLNVEVWDANHRKPPLVQVTPKDDGSFATKIDVSALRPGKTTWTVYAWDSPPGESFDHTTSVSLELTIADTSAGADSCTGQTCSGHGTCGVSAGRATCTCDSDYRAVGLACLPTQAAGDGTGDPGTDYVPAGYDLVFRDEFTGGGLDTGKWNTLAPFGVQWFGDSHQKQAFIPEAVSLNDDLVSLTAQRSNGGNTNGQPYSSGSITTNQTFTHGYFEARVRVPHGKGFWPAFWLTSSSRWPPEWDIFEIVDGVIFGYTHPVSGGKCSFIEGAAGADSTYTVSEVYDSFHVYGFLWTATDLYWYVDGTLTEHYAVDDKAGANDPFWLNLSLQVGGDWPGDPDGTTPLPSQMDVDYVRVYQNGQ